MAPLTAVLPQTAKPKNRVREIFMVKKAVDWYVSIYGSSDNQEEYVVSRTL